MNRKFNLLFGFLSIYLLAYATANFAAGLRVKIDSIRIETGYLTIDVHSDGLLDKKTINGLQQGFNSVVRYRFQLWRKKLLFSSLVIERYYDVKLFYDNWNQKFTYETPNERRKTSFIDKVRTACSELNNIPLKKIADLENDAAYYISVELQFEPISDENYKELRTWLQGDKDEEKRAEDKKSKEKGHGKGRLFAILIDLLGFGDKVINVKSSEFTIADLK